MLHVPVYTILLGTPDGVVQHKLPGGYTETIQVPPDAATLQLIARTSGGQFFTASNDKHLGEVYEQLQSRLGHKRSRARSPTSSRRLGLLLLAGGALFGALVPEGAVRRLSLVLVVLVSSVSAARAGHCGGRDERVQRPDDVRARRRAVGGRPGVATTPRPQVQYQLTCPKGYIVAGIDAELSDPAIDLPFLGDVRERRSRPGVTTSRTIVFVATYVGNGRGHRPSVRTSAASRRREAGPRTPTAVRGVPRPATRPRAGSSPSASAASPRWTSPATPTSVSSAGYLARGSGRPTPPSPALVSSLRATDVTCRRNAVESSSRARRRGRGDRPGRAQSARVADELRAPAPAPDPAVLPIAVAALPAGSSAGGRATR